MSVSLSSLVTRLAALLPTRDGVPTAAQQEQAVKDAVVALSRRLPLTKQTTLTLASSTTTYSLPSDFLMLIRLQFPAAADNPYGFPGAQVVSTSAGLTPVPVLPYRRITRDWYTIQGQTIVFNPAPTTSGGYTLRYGAAHILSDDGDTYATLTDELAYVALLKAQTDLLRVQAQQAAQESDITNYEQGDVRVEIDNAATAKALNARAADLETQYEQRLHALQGVGGMRSYPW